MRANSEFGIPFFRAPHPSGTNSDFQCNGGMEFWGLLIVDFGLNCTSGFRRPRNRIWNGTTEIESSRSKYRKT